MLNDEKKNLQEALSKGLLKRLPLTFLPFVNQQLREWDFLFPNERQSIETLLFYVDGLSDEQSSELFRTVVDLEEKMDVRHWHFATNEQTILNSSELARSPYFQQWRQAVQAVFDAADAHARKTSEATKQPNRLVLLGLPKVLPLNADSVWKRWKGTGKTVQLDLGKLSKQQSALELLLTGVPNLGGVPAVGILEAINTLPADKWVVDAGSSLVDAVLNQNTSAPKNAGATLLSYTRLNQYRESFSREMNTMRKDLADADAVFDRLRKVDVTPWCPAEVAGEPAVREFLRSLYLTGNGAVIFGNSFVEWAASEAIRRARPNILVAQFGVRSKPKPFTGVSIFDNPDQVNPLPSVDDLPGSAMDAQMLALYVWMAARRYNEYQPTNTVCVCVAESLAQAYVVAPQNFALLQEAGPIPLDQLGHALRMWLA